MSSIEENKNNDPEQNQKKPVVRRSSLKSGDAGSKLDPHNLLKIKGSNESNVSRQSRS